MLKELLPLLRPGDTLGLTIACETAAGADPIAQPATYRINVLPKLFTLDGEKDEARLALNTPLSITGTADELDSSEFVATLTRFTNSANALRHTIDEAEEAHKAAGEKKKAPPAAKADTKKSDPKPAGKSPSWKDRVKPGSKPAAAKNEADDNDDDDEKADDAATPKAAAEPAAKAVKPVEAATPSLI